MAERVEIRCPGKFRKLFLVLTKEFLPADGTHLHVACGDCARERRKGEPSIKQVIHSFDLKGTCTRTEAVR